MAAEPTTVDHLRTLLPGSVLRGDGRVAVTGVSVDSRRVEPGDLFCCIPGATTDGHEHAPAAVASGAAALLVERDLDLPVPQLRVDAARPAMALAAAAVHGHPSRDLVVIGVTGTNGKTTVTYLLDAILREAGRPTAVLGTLSGPRTTPEAPDLQRWLAARRDEGTGVVAMEVSSHALALHRVDGTWFAAAVFTNLSRDHLDFHETMESYFEAKARLFTPELSARAIVNIDDPSGRLLRDSATIDTASYSLDDVTDLRVGRNGSTFGWRGQHVTLPLGGRFNVANALAAAETAVLVLGVDPATVARGLGRPLVIPGRFELVDAGQPFTVIVDYAHTPDGLDRLLEAAGEMAAGGRVHVVFGCGGDRDPTKRPAMGAVAAERADRVVLTADNSRSEDTAAIIEAVQQGIRQVPDPRAQDVVVEPDRRAAIALAIGSAAPDDVVVLAGKGHETTQTIGDRVVAFDDREVARELLAGGGGR
jgi:UDP-N-acetylmuramoyl-L-alanyl-D-glutamate--2,6-diaminopimelate ligase